MTKIKGKWIRQEDTEVKILEKLLRKGPLNIPKIEDKKGKERLSHTSVLIGISKLLAKKSVIIINEDKSIPKRSVKTFEITPVGMYQYLQWIFPEEQIPEFADEMWESIKKSGVKFHHKNITPYYFPIIDAYWEKLEGIGAAPSWFFGVAFGRTEFHKTPHARDMVEDHKFPLPYLFSFNVHLGGSDFDYNRSYELKISEVALVRQNTDKLKSKKSSDSSGIYDFSELRNVISNTITFLFFYHILYEIMQRTHIFKFANDNNAFTEDENILNSILLIIKNDKNLQAIFREHLAIISSRVKTDRTISYLFHSTA